MAKGLRAVSRLLVSAAFACALCLYLSAPASAQVGVCSSTALEPGDSIGVSGSGASPGETATLEFNGSAIGAGTVDGFGNFSVSGNVPGSTTPGTYPITVSFTVSGAIAPCSGTVQDDATPPDDDDDDDDNDDDNGDDDSATDDDDDDVPAPVQQQQQQQQQVVLPAPAVIETVYVPKVVAANQRSLPQTGTASLLPLIEGGSGSLLVGLSLVRLTRRRRPASPPPPPPHIVEGDLLLPYLPNDDR